MPSLSRPVIIGTQYHATPAMAAKLNKIVLNPYWVLPQSVVREVLLKQDPVSYLLKKPYTGTELSGTGNPIR